MNNSIENLDKGIELLKLLKELEKYSPESIKKYSNYLNNKN
ncbi:hypothetical protein ACED96_15330 [Clostridium thermobutyricum]